MKWFTFFSRPRHIGRMFAVIFLAGVSFSGAQVLFRAGTILPPTGSETNLIGSIVAIPDGAAEVVSVPDGARQNMHFYRFNTHMEIMASEIHSLGELSYYGPALCWNGEGFGVVASTFTSAVFLVLDHDGQTVLGPQELPGIPFGGRTAGFRVLWTGTHYAVFGLWLEKSNPLQDLSSGTFYTHLHYWLLNPDGSAAVHRELAMLAPISYPGIEGAEKAYFDVVFTGNRYFLAYYSESESGPPLGGYYRIYDMQGDVIAGEQPVFAEQVTQGARLAWNGRSIAATGLRSDTMGGNFMYVRCFEPDGTPRGTESNYGHFLGFSPTVFAAANRFVTAYVVMYDWDNLGYALMLNEFDESAASLGSGYPAADADGNLLLGRIGLGFDLQITSGPDIVYAMAQTSDAWGITHQPVSFGLRYRAPDWPRLIWVNTDGEPRLQWHDDATGYQLMESPDLAGAWTPVTAEPTEAEGFKRLAVDFQEADKRFFRLYRPAQP